MNPRKHAQMMAAFDAFSYRMAKRYSEVRDCLEANRYEEAHMLLSGIAASHAKTSLSLRNVLVRDGVIGGDDK
jgi:hypothetical protein